MLWHRLDQELPPLRKPVLIWRGMSDSDGGFPMMGKHVLFEGKSYIRYKDCDDRWQVLDESEYKDTRWAEVERPEE